ncbi:glycine, alanine and asparagine-rich protein-like [Brachypodium distachyon]|uniref:glycine, alanine and asparagine-rich protein-like n=1 Tax=Brachypodium distachyon TaxID=15368 RepID=UPI00052FF70A|nr:glycine, alanine and asparagine-rich protein-like [Brachypodium distachyon]|eukprot:XP_010239191.1 glycine, alanine and asparagine-rich protein-like [Brachypodium distachyon]
MRIAWVKRSIKTNGTEGEEEKSSSVRLQRTRNEDLVAPAAALQVASSAALAATAASAVRAAVQARSASPRGSLAGQLGLHPCGSVQAVVGRVVVAGGLPAAGTGLVQGGGGLPQHGGVAPIPAVAGSVGGVGTGTGMEPGDFRGGHERGYCGGYGGYGDGYGGGYGSGLAGTEAAMEGMVVDMVRTAVIKAALLVADTAAVLEAGMAVEVFVVAAIVMSRSAVASTTMAVVGVAAMVTSEALHQRLAV